MEQIEKLLAQVKEKDSIISELQYGINDMKNELRKVQNPDSELSSAKRECDDRFAQYRRILNEKVLLYD